MQVRLNVNGQPAELDLEPRDTLLDVLRQRLSLTGVHAGCEHGVCGACTVLVDGETVRSCLMFGVQAEGHDVVTIEGFTPNNGLHPIQEAFRECHGLQCGFCTPGMILAAAELLSRSDDPTDEEIAEAMSGNICRCTGYVGIVDAVHHAAGKVKAGADS
jgi:carbon-monoxide dehydrogenase small subunit